MPRYNNSNNMSHYYHLNRLLIISFIIVIISSYCITIIYPFTTISRNIIIKKKEEQQCCYHLDKVSAESNHHLHRNNINLIQLFTNTQHNDDNHSNHNCKSHQCTNHIHHNHDSSHLNAVSSPLSSSPSVMATLHNNKKGMKSSLLFRSKMTLLLLSKFIHARLNPIHEWNELHKNNNDMMIIQSSLLGRITKLHNPITYFISFIIFGFKYDWCFKSPIYWFILGFCIKWYRAKYVFKIPVWDRQPNWNNIITSKEQEKDLKAYTCKNCGSTIFIAKTREFFFEGNTGFGGLGCFSCGARGADNFIQDRERIVDDVGDMDDYFEYERPLDFISRAERRKLLKEAKGDETLANEILLNRATSNTIVNEEITITSKPSSDIVDAVIMVDDQQQNSEDEDSNTIFNDNNQQDNDNDDVVNCSDMNISMKQQQKPKEISLISQDNNIDNIDTESMKQEHHDEEHEQSLIEKKKKKKKKEEKSVFTTTSKTTSSSSDVEELDILDMDSF